MDAEAVDDGGGGFVHADQLHIRAFAAELDDGLVQGGHRGYIPEVCSVQIDDHFIDGFLEIEGRNELARRIKALLE